MSTLREQDTHASRTGWMAGATATRAARRMALALVVAGCSGTATPTMPAPTGLPQPSVAESPVPSVAAGPSAEPSPVRDPGATRTDDHDVRQVWVPGGVFKMGSAEGSATPPSWAVATYRSEHPAHEVAIGHGYWIDLTEVTVAEFLEFKSAGGYEDESV